MPKIPVVKILLHHIIKLKTVQMFQHYLIFCHDSSNIFATLFSIFHPVIFVYYTKVMTKLPFTYDVNI